jgi:glycosyltransferase involved in cell wall biosynthesis
MIRICTSLANAGYEVELVGVKNSKAPPLLARSYKQRRLGIFFEKGFGFYAEYNIRLFFYLLFTRADIYCCIDLDTMLPVYFAAKIKGKTKVYDAHEYFSQMKEIVTRPIVYKVWHWIERTFIPKFKKGYTVCESISKEFKGKYGVEYGVIRNVPLLSALKAPIAPQKVILYQGAVNEGRGFEYLIPAMKQVDIPLLIYGDGNFMEQTKVLITKNKVESKVFIKGKVLPGELQEITENCYIGLNLVENTGLNQYFSLANKFFDYIHCGIPQVTMNFPEYKSVNDNYEVAVLVNDLSTDSIAIAINSLINDALTYQKLKENCVKAREDLNWQREEVKLISFYKQLGQL